MDTVIKIENLSKLYKLGEVGTGTISHDLNRWWAKIRGKEDPYALVGQTNDRTKKSESDYVWSLKDINFDVAQGDVLGIIGKNGAGKSTLLKIISQITAPTTGNIKIKGRIAALLEVGTGMNPEMTARENIYLNGAILGMRKKEIDSKFDEIVDFSGCTMYVDTPIKRFSSGMRVRLGFAVAAFLEPEILIIDEVLAVGDAEFQKKAIGKMQDISKSDGRTVLFVSHNLVAVKSLCNKAILLHNGQIIDNANPDDIISKYLSQTSNTKVNVLNNTINNSIFIEFIEIKNEYEYNNIPINKPFSILVGLEIFTHYPNIYYHVNIFITDGSDTILFVLTNRETPITEIGKYKIEFQVPKNFINDIHYGFDVMIIQNRSQIIYNHSNAITISGVEIEKRDGWLGKYPGLLRPTEFKNIIHKI
jgi:lipopolysaccharide transport system ATP-binding protein